MRRHKLAGLVVLATLTGIFSTVIYGQQPTEQAIAPADIIAATIADMPPGTQATASPEALVIDENKKVWLNKHQPVGGETGVVIHYLKDGSYEVEIKDEKLKWLKVPLTDDIKKVLVPVKTLHLPKKK